MKITLWGINYAPESIGIAPFNRELCTYLASEGHEVSALTTFAYYPRWQIAPTDRATWFRTDHKDGVLVHRCRCYVPANATPLRRIVHELTFGLTSLYRALTLPRADLYLVISPPLGLGCFAWLATRLKRSCYVFHVQDLQPDAAVGLGMIKPGGFTRLLYALERFAYAKAARVTGISAGILTAFAQKGLPPARTALLPNWLHHAAIQPTPATRAAARARFAVPTAAFLAVYAGNLGRKQALEIVIHAAALLPPTVFSATAPAPIHLIIAGDGAARADLAACLAAHPGVPVTLLPLLSERDYAALLAAADLALITQTAGSGQFFFPSKLLSMLAAGLPVVAVADADSELALAVADGAFGTTIPPGDALTLAALLTSLATDPTRLATWAARTTWVQRFAPAVVLPCFAQVLHEAANLPLPAARTFAPSTVA